MQAMALEEYGGPEALEPMELPDRKVGPDVVLIRARAAGVNPVDAGVRAGNLDGAFPSFFPLVPGWDVAGVVESAGPGGHLRRARLGARLERGPEAAVAELRGGGGDPAGRPHRLPGRVRQAGATTGRDPADPGRVGRRGQLRRAARRNRGR